LSLITGSGTIRRWWLRDPSSSRLQGNEGEPVMSKQDEFRQYAGECIESARTAPDVITRKSFLDLARMWMTAAQQMDDDIVIPNPQQRPSVTKSVIQ
jgi:hypothetical protein